MQERKLTVGGVIGTIILGCLILALLIYTATRTIHFLQMTFPPSMSYVAYLALSAFDGGIIGWTIFATFASEGASQRGIAYLMIFICAIGVILTTIADTLLVSQQNGLTKAPPDIATVGMWGSIAIIVLNVVAGITVHLASPHHIRKYQMESMRDDIYRAAMKHTKTKVNEQIPALAQGMANFEIARLAQELVGHLPPRADARQLPAPRVIDADRSKIVYASKDQVLDPTEVAPVVDAEPRKKIESKPSLADRIWAIRDKIDEKLDSGKQTQTIETVVEEETPVEEEIIEDDLPENYLDWRDEEWKKAKKLLTPDQFNELFDEVFPPEGIKPTPKKRSGGKKTKKVDQAD